MHKIPADVVYYHRERQCLSFLRLLIVMASLVAEHRL